MSAVDIDKAVNAWIAVDKDTLSCEFPYPAYVLELDGEGRLFSAITEGDWVIVATSVGEFTRVGRVLRLREDTRNTTIYFDSLFTADGALSLESAGLALPTSGSVGRLQWSDFVNGLSKLTSKKLDDVPLIQHQAYIRELLQLAVMDDLLGPANGPHEQIVDMSVRDRYLVGKLAPRETENGGIEGLEGPLASEADEGEPDDLDVHKGRHDPGAEFDGATGTVNAEADSCHRASA